MGHVGMKWGHVGMKWGLSAKHKILLKVFGDSGDFDEWFFQYVVCVRM